MGASAGNILPNEVPSLYGWWDASDFKDLTDGTEINTWSDKSGNGFDLNWENYNGQSNKSLKQKGSNDNACLSGAGIYKTSGMSLGANQPFTFFIVFKANSASNNAVFGSTQDAAAFGLINANGASNLFLASAISLLMNPPDTTSYHQLTSLCSTSANERVLNFDMKKITMSYNNISGITNLWLNSRTVGNGGNGSNNHCEIIIYNRAITFQEIRQIERYLNFKWQLRN